MSRKLTLKFFSVLVAFTSFFGNIAYSFSEEAFELALENAMSNEDIKIKFTQEIPGFKNSPPVGFHNVKNYCRLIGCKQEDLEKLLKGKIIGKGFVDDAMVKDFMKLANKVKTELGGKEKKYENSVPCSSCYKYLSKKGSKLCWACNKKFGKKFK